MTKGNVIDFHTYCDKTDIRDASNDPTISEELQQAIQNLIHRMRELGPISNS